LIDLFDQITHANVILISPIHIKGKIEDYLIEIVIAPSNISCAHRFTSYADNVFCPENGTHVDGIILGLMRLNVPTYIGYIGVVQFSYVHWLKWAGSVKSKVMNKEFIEWSAQIVIDHFNQNTYDWERLCNSLGIDPAIKSKQTGFKDTILS
jgi:hypothetical protein